METKNNGGGQWWQVEQHSWTFPLFFVFLPLLKNYF